MPRRCRPTRRRGRGRRATRAATVRPATAATARRRSPDADRLARRPPTSADCGSGSTRGASPAATRSKSARSGTSRRAARSCPATTIASSTRCRPTGTPTAAAWRSISRSRPATSSAATSRRRGAHLRELVRGAVAQRVRQRQAPARRLQGQGLDRRDSPDLGRRRPDPPPPPPRRARRSGSELAAQPQPAPRSAAGSAGSPRATITAQTRSPVTFSVVRHMSSSRSTPSTIAIASPGTPTATSTLTTSGSDRPGRRRCRCRR